MSVSGQRQLGRRWRALAAAATTLAVVVLPPLAAGTGYAAPPAAFELTSLQQALAAPGSADAPNEVARQYFVAAVGGPSVVVPAAADARLRLVGRARLLQLAVIGGLAGLCYLAVLLARGRVQALLACAVLAVLPPVASAGAFVRLEAPSALFTALALVLLQSFAQTALRRARGGRWRRAASLVGLGACAATSLGLAIAALPSVGAPVLMPGLVLTLGAAMLAVRAVRALRRRGIERLPCRALNARLLPWTALSLAAPALVIAVLSLAAVGAGTAAAGTPSDVGLMPSPWLAGALVWTLLGIGALAAVLRIGLRFGRGGRIGAEVVLLVYCALELTAAAGAPPAADRLPAAPALAIVLAEGVRFALAALRVGWRRVAGVR